MKNRYGPIIENKSPSDREKFYWKKHIVETVLSES